MRCSRTPTTTRTPTSSTTDLAALGLGSNLGRSEDRLRAAIRSLREVIQPLRYGPLFRSRPLGDLPQRHYLNTVVVGCPLLPPDELLAVAKALELAAGRRSAPRHAPRRLDVDLLLYGDLMTDRPELTLPHPGLRQRRFVLAPLAAIAPDLAVPPDGATIADLLARVGQAGEVRRISWREIP